MSGSDGGWVDEGPLARGAMAELRRVRRGTQRGVRKVAREDQAANPVFQALLAIEDLALRRLAGVGEVVARLDSGPGWLVLEEGWAPPACADWADAGARLERIGRALTAGHALGVVHRDPKRANLLWTGRGVVLADYGAARIDGIADPAPALGSPEAFAPERLAGAPASPATDAFALGVLGWELVTGALPFPSTRWAELAALQARGLPAFRPHFLVPPAAEERLVALLARDPAARPPLVGWRA